MNNGDNVRTTRSGRRAVSTDRAAGAKLSAESKPLPKTPRRSCRPRISRSDDKVSPTKQVRKVTEQSDTVSRSRKSSPNDEVSPPKRSRKATNRSGNTAPKKKPVARNLIPTAEPSEGSNETPQVFEAESTRVTTNDIALEDAWAALHEFSSNQSTDNIGWDHDNLNDDICMICGEAGLLTVCCRCRHSICSDCIYNPNEMERIDVWDCSFSRLNCTKRNYKKPVVDDGEPKRGTLRSTKNGVARASKFSKKLFNVGDFVEVNRKFAPAIVLTKAWGLNPDSDSENNGSGPIRPCLARIRSYSPNLVQVEFLIYPDQTTLNCCKHGELLISPVLYDMSFAWILGKPPKPVYLHSMLSKMKRLPKRGSYFFVRRRYDFGKRVTRALVDCDPDESEETRLVDTKTTNSSSKLNHVEDAIQRLQLSNAPVTLPCRDAECKQIENVLRTSIKVGGSGAGLYISGLPGTGKTATVRRVVKLLHQDLGKSAFKYIEVNALKLQSPVHAYSELWLSLSGKRCSPAMALHNLHEYFSSTSTGKRRENKPTTVLVLDEFDYLVQGNSHKVIYNLFGFPSAEGSRLVVVGIANTLGRLFNGLLQLCLTNLLVDLPERLGGKTFSRLGLARMNFEPYTSAQIEEIILSRLKGLREYVDTNAISYCAKSVASMSGDVRRALEIVATAVEMSKNEACILEINHIIAARNLFADSTTVQVIKAASYQECTMLCALMQELKTTGKYESEYDVVVRKHKRILLQQGHLTPPSTVIDRIIYGLANMNLIGLLFKRGAVRPDLRLIANQEDIKFALADSPLSVII